MRGLMVFQFEHAVLREAMTREMRREHRIVLIHRGKQGDGRREEAAIFSLH